MRRKLAIKFETTSAIGLAIGIGNNEVNTRTLIILIPFFAITIWFK